ncbi:unnamed protein product [Effrenium voratum]|nr:unnamed protein product [Effrenium voratum]
MALVQWAILWAGQSFGHPLASSQVAGLGYYAEGAVETVERWHFGQVEVVVQVDVAMRSLTGLRIWPAARRLAELLAKDAPSERRTRSLVRRRMFQGAEDIKDAGGQQVRNKPTVSNM